MNRTVVTVSYGALALLYLVVFNHDSWLGAAVKAAPILLLATAAFALAAPSWRLSLVLALLFSALGDVLLAAHAIVGGLWVAGLGAFLVAQLIYAQQFWRHQSNEPWRRLLALMWLPIAALLAWRIAPATGELIVPVTAYLLAITAMVTGAALADRPLVLFAGALCFAFSDGSIAVNRFVEPLANAGTVIMLSYYLAQWLIWYGALGPSQQMPPE